MHIIIDGYNLIRQSSALSELDLADVEAGREALIETLADYRRIKRHRITVVFDGSGAPYGVPAREQVKGIAVRYSARGESADDVIKRLAAREGEKAVVVSSDRDIINYAESKGAATIASPAFETKLALAAYRDAKGCLPDEEEAEQQRTTRKKGPRRRQSKKDRRRRVKTGKL
jgi:predicted RNA-binding protein with PIN domain